MQNPKPPLKSAMKSSSSGKARKSKAKPFFITNDISPNLPTRYKRHTTKITDPWIPIYFAVLDLNLKSLVNQTTKCCKVTPETKSYGAQSKEVACNKEAQRNFTQALEEIEKLWPRLHKDTVLRLNDLTIAMRCLIQESVKSYSYYTTEPDQRPYTPGKFETRLRAKGHNVLDIFWDLRKIVGVRGKTINLSTTTRQRHGQPGTNHPSSSQPVEKPETTNPSQSSSDLPRHLNNKLQNIVALTRALQFQQHESIQSREERSSDGELMAHFNSDRQFLAIADTEQEINLSLLKPGRLLVEGSVNIEGAPKPENILSTMDFVMQQIEDFVDEVMIPDPQRPLENNKIKSESGKGNQLKDHIGEKSKVEIGNIDPVGN